MTRLLLLVLTALLLCGCQSSALKDSDSHAKVSRERALELAKRRFAEIYPGRLKDYKVSISGDLDKDAWCVIFTGTGDYAVPGGFTPMLVNKDNGNIQVLQSQ